MSRSWRNLLVAVIVTSALFALPSSAAEVAIVRVDPLKEQLALTETQHSAFMAAYRDYAAKKESSLRRAKLKARGKEDATRRSERAIRKAHEGFDKDIREILTREQFTLFLTARAQIVGSLSQRQSGFSDASIPNPGGLLGEPGVYGGNN